MKRVVLCVLTVALSATMVFAENSPRKIKKFERRVNERWAETSQALQEVQRLMESNYDAVTKAQETGGGMPNLQASKYSGGVDNLAQLLGVHAEDFTEQVWPELEKMLRFPYEGSGSCIEHTLKLIRPCIKCIQSIGVGLGKRCIAWRIIPSISYRWPVDKVESSSQMYLSRYIPKVINKLGRDMINGRVGFFGASVKGPDGTRLILDPRLRIPITEGLRTSIQMKADLFSFWTLYASKQKAESPNVKMDEIRDDFIESIKNANFDKEVYDEIEKAKLPAALKNLNPSFSKFGARLMEARVVPELFSRVAYEQIKKLKYPYLVIELYILPKPHVEYKIKNYPLVCHINKDPKAATADSSQDVPVTATPPTDGAPQVEAVSMSSRNEYALSLGNNNSVVNACQKAIGRSGVKGLDALCHMVASELPAPFGTYAYSRMPALSLFSKLAPYSIPSLKKFHDAYLVFMKNPHMCMDMETLAKIGVNLTGPLDSALNNAVSQFPDPLVRLIVGELGHGRPSRQVKWSQVCLREKRGDISSTSPVSINGHGILAAIPNAFKELGYEEKRQNFYKHDYKRVDSTVREMRDLLQLIPQEGQSAFVKQSTPKSCFPPEVKEEFFGYGLEEAVDSVNKGPESTMIKYRALACCPEGKPFYLSPYAGIIEKALASLLGLKDLQLFVERKE
ncbi:MAG: hypothetical protein GYA55_12365 [SAR324 cluster bacterium]|uniref:Uncharacterized protein n=1 Tax=SAR324 cluster bacterium TaxID=2024889 RepID=A0A7X9FU69_9DELT|nr:hypothetical protein [SAR324 cluster bacterium]